MQKYGTENVLQSLEIQSKISKTNIIKYGFPNPGQSEIIKEKIKITKIANGNQIADIYLNEYRKYRKKVDSMTEKLKKESSKLYIVIKEKYPDLSDQDIRLQMEPELNKVDQYFKSV